MEEGVAHRGEARRRGRFSWSVHVQGATAALGAAVAARRQTRRRRDQLKENARALAKLDEALMASLMVRVSSALEEHGAPATSNGGGGNGAYG